MAVPVSAFDCASEPGSLGSVQRELLRLLAGGLTDEAAAWRLGISLRTTGRHMAALMSTLGAASRFQAGVQATRNGWLAT
jgi:DNA-binding NarL/FixJ family response regulator